ncbi:3-oxoadipate enol-lactonase [Phreatobacter stygius]|uniref:3-oxoadipate enol-lactonase n=1 Tax=Phreatobacter stygius TaxID=1940610 RepID=A0A4D7B0A7_9HYPH|nr:3-oxoadipate enol-lactonase [Phreatobacter stygius]QCI62856.1 3-oxoadipate enol-lactonase [Phreatobacter stygius]
MPRFTTSDGLSLRYEDTGGAGPALLLSNSLGTRLEMWDPQMPAFSSLYRVVRYDKRGHGESDLKAGPTSFARLTRDAVELLDHLNIDKADWCGLSMGGMSGMWAGTHHGRRFGKIVLCNTAASMPTADMWNQRIAIVKSQGLKPLIPTIVDRWFTKRFQAADGKAVARVVEMLETTPAEGYAAASAAIRDMDQREAIRSIGNPVLVISGTHDGSTPPERGREIAAAIPKAKYVELDAAHLSNIEQDKAFTATVTDFLKS